jgi:hypothetical protein
MRLAAIFILLPQLLYSQSMYVIQGYETNNYNEPINGYTKRWASIYAGTNIYNCSETIQLIHPTWSLSPTNCVVENQYVWGHYEFDQTVIDVVIKFVVNPTITPDKYITIWVMGGFPSGSYPIKPHTRIANYTTVTGSYTDKQYCRNTWRLSNPTQFTQYYQFQYNVGLPVATGNCFEGYVVPAFHTNDIVFRYMDLVWINDPYKYVLTSYPTEVAEGPYSMGSATVPPYVVIHTGDSGYYVQPPAPTRKAVMDYLQTGFFTPQR